MERSMFPQSSEIYLISLDKLSPSGRRKFTLAPTQTIDFSQLWDYLQDTCSILHNICILWNITTERVSCLADIMKELKDITYDWAKIMLVGKNKNSMVQWSPETGVDKTGSRHTFSQISSYTELPQHDLY